MSFAEAFAPGGFTVGFATHLFDNIDLFDALFSSRKLIYAAVYCERFNFSFLRRFTLVKNASSLGLCSILLMRGSAHRHDNLIVSAAIIIMQIIILCGVRYYLN